MSVDKNVDIDNIFSVENVLHGSLLAVRPVYALCKLSPEGKLYAAKLTWCMSSGPSPIWNITNLRGKTERFLGSKLQVEEFYRGFTWRRLYAHARVSYVSPPKTEFENIRTEITKTPVKKVSKEEPSKENDYGHRHFGTENLNGLFITGD